MAAEDRDVVRGNLLFSRTEQVFGLALDSRGVDALFTQLRFNKSLACARHLTLSLLAVLVGALPQVDSLVGSRWCSHGEPRYKRRD